MQYSISQRPRFLREIKGQDSIVKDLLKRQMELRWPKAMLFRGKYGTGKTSTAMAVALAIQCRNITDTGEPCLQCGSCQSIINEKYDRDTHMIDGSLLGQKDYVTEKLELVKIAPMQDVKRLFIIEEADQLSNAAINAFHKILEEPNERVHFLLLCMDTGSLPPSIQSRCQVYNFKPFTVKDTMVALRDLMKAEDIWDSEKIPNSFRMEGLASIANASKGSYREALQYLERCLSGEYYTPEDIRNHLGIVDESSVIKILFSLLEKDDSVWMEIYRTDPKEITALSLTILTDAMLCKVAGVIINEIYESQTKALAGHANFLALYKAFDSIRESSKTFIRKPDLHSALISYWSDTKKLQETPPMRIRSR